MAPGALVALDIGIGSDGPIPVREFVTKISSVQASVLYGPRKLDLVERTLEPPGFGELQIAIKCTGICGSDLSYYKKCCNGDLKARGPLTLGHESSGVVEAVGDGVTGYTVGDRVALEVGVPCDDCRACQTGRYNLCGQMKFRSSAKSFPHFQGTLQTRINHKAKWCHKIPSHVTMEAAALLEPLSVAIHATNRATVEPGDTVLVFGAGAVGLLTAAMAKVCGATNVVIADIDLGRVRFALQHQFATRGFVVPLPKEANTVEERIAAAKYISDEALRIAFSKRGNTMDVDLTDPLLGADVVFDCTGKEICVQAGLFAARPGGQLVMVGMGTPIQTLQLSAAHLKEVDIIGIFRYCNTYKKGLQILSSGILPSLDNMVTHRFRGLNRTQDAMETASRTVDDEGRLVLKVLIET